jgi:uncharacterized membrane protein YsdA (DUF1294 family)
MRNAVEQIPHPFGMSVHPRRHSRVAHGRKGRNRQKPAMAGRPGIVGMIFFTAFLILPAMAAWRVAQQTDWRVVLLYLFTLSVATVVLYRHDKRAAQSQSGAWRTPETVLHLAELGGGWAAAYFAQQVFRHKTSKAGYQLIYWLIGFLHQFFALDFLLDWRISRGVFG